MALCDAVFTLDTEGKFLSVSWGSERAENWLRPFYEEWRSHGTGAADAFSLAPETPAGSGVFQDESIEWLFLPAPEGCRYLLLRRESDREFLLLRALDQMSEGVQVYDRNAHAVFFNRASRGISHIPDGVDIEGRHLLDLYSLDENISTTMTALRTRAPVINRVDRFTVPDGSTALTANTSYPVFRQGRLAGAVVFEQTEELVRQELSRLEATSQALATFTSKSVHMGFSGYTFENVIGHGKKLLEAVELGRKAAGQTRPVLLVGETGTGKEIFAQSIHRSSSRRGKKFLAINCAAIPETLIEGTLFGTQKGGFTGSENRPGYLEEACGGTLFLDELNSMSLAMQSKLLRVLQENTFRRVGGSRDIALDVRIISSCNEDPFQAIADNRLRRDLFYRLSAMIIELPPLRDHLEDLDELVSSHLDATAYQHVSPVPSLDPEVWRIFRSYPWPGNVRELFHVLDYAWNVSDSDTLRPEHLPSYLRRETAAPEKDSPEVIDFSDTSLQALLDSREHQILVQALDYCGGNITRTAQTLGILRQSLQYRIRKYGIVI